jgi:hypothetical protein
MVSRDSVGGEILAPSVLRSRRVDLNTTIKGKKNPPIPRTLFLEQGSTKSDRPTLGAWSHPEKDLVEIMETVSTLKKSSAPEVEMARRALAHLGLALIAATPLQNNLLEGLDVNKTRRILQRATPGAWAGDRKEENRLGPTGVIRRTALRSLAHQVAELQRGRSTGNPLDPALEQSAYLAGMAGLQEQAMKDLSALLSVMGGKDQREGMSKTLWENAAERGRMKRDSLRTESTLISVPSRSPESTFTALRVTELMPGALGSSASRHALIASLKHRAALQGLTHDVLVVNGGVAKDRDEDALRKILREHLNKMGMDSYLATVQIVVLAEDRFAPENVLEHLPREFSPLSMDLITVNPAAVLVDPLRSATSYRVLLLELWGEELLYVDLVDLARQTLKAARVVAIGA